MPKVSRSPAGWRGRLQRLAWRLPPVQRADARFHEVEAEVLKGLKRRLADLDGESDTFSSGLGGLLEASLDAGPDRLERLNRQALVAPLCPDEARLLAALSDGSPFPMVAVREGGLFGRGAVLHRYSSAGRRAGIQCQELVPLYLQRLIGSGLALALSGDPQLRIEYELCESDAGFRRAREELARSVSRLKTEREVLMISPAGRLLWQSLIEDAADEDGEGE